MQTALGVVGGIIGSFWGYPQLGFVVGSLIGYALTPKEKVEGPRIDDQKVTVSTYGAGIPKIYGTVRVGGNVIWSTDKIDIPETTSQGGKGGGVESTTHHYYVSMFVALCKAPPPGSTIALRKVWKDGKLNYDQSSGQSVGQALASLDNPMASVIIYQGDEDQLPIPGMEALAGGPGSVPAYRGICGAWITQLECPGGRMPQLSFELCVDPLVTGDAGDLCSAPDDAQFGLYVDGIVWHGVYEIVNSPSSTNKLSVFDGSRGSLELQRVIDLEYDGYSPTTPTDPRPCPGGADPIWIRNYSNNSLTQCRLETINLANGRIETIYSYSKLSTVRPLLSNDYATAGFDPITGRYMVFGGYETDQKTQPRTFLNGVMVTCAPIANSVPGPAAIYNGVVYVVTSNGGAATSKLAIETFDAATGAALDFIEGPVLGTGAPSPASTALCVNEFGVFVLKNSDSPSTDSRFYRITSTWELMFPAVIQQNRIGYARYIFCDGDFAVFGPDYLGKTYQLARGVLTGVGVPVADIIEDQCLEAGLAMDQIDVSAVSSGDTVHGYTLTNPASARANLEPMLSAFAIDAAEEDAKLKFFNRANRVSVATISYDELASAEDGQSGDPMPLTRAQERELPRSVAVSYINPDFDYQTGTERDKRQITEAQVDQTVDLAMAISADQAATAAHRMLYDAHNERNRRSFKVSRKYAFMSAGDVATFEYPRGMLGDYYLLKTTDTGVLIEGECVPFDAALYARTAVGTPGSGGQVMDPLPGLTKLIPLDIPILRDNDSNAGVYMAMSGLGPDWVGATLEAGTDAATLDLVGEVRNAAVNGPCETTLGNWTLGIVDETNLLTVNVGTGTLSSVTRDVLLAGTENVAAVGVNGRWELLKFQRADFLGVDADGNNRYILSGLIRGLRGTEYRRSTHAAGETFVLLSTKGMLRPSMSTSELYVERLYRATSRGRSSGTDYGFSNTGEGLRPLSPYNLRRSISATNDVTLTWSRRTRLSDNWLMGIVPLGETSEQYVLEFYTTSGFSTFAGYLVALAPTITLTAAQQTAWGLTPGAVLNVRISQMSSSVDKGHELQAVI